MHFSPATALVAFISLAAANPITPHKNAGTGTSATNKCGISSFVPVTGTGLQPTLDNCYKLRDQVGKNKFKVSGAITIAKFGDCAFSASPITKGEFGYIGQQDIHDIVEDAIKRWQSAGSHVAGYKGTITKQVGTAGDVPCDTDGGKQVEIAWTIGRA